MEDELVRLLSKERDLAPLPESKLEGARTTFKISSEGLEAKQRLIDLLQANGRDAIDYAWSVASEPKTLAFIAQLIDGVKHTSQTHRKVHVLSPRTLKAIGDSAKERGVTRDLMFDAVLRLGAALAGLQKERVLEVRRAALEKVIEPTIKKLADAEARLEKMLGSDDPIVARWGTLMVIADNLESAVSAHLDFDAPIDPNEM